MEKEIRVCGGHQEYPTPLLWTFAFNYAEYWCPYCGDNYGMLGAGRIISNTPKLQERHDRYKEFSNEFLHAHGIRVCVSTMWEGERVTPDKLPQHEKDRLEKIIRDWRYEIKIESITTEQTL